MATFQLFCQLGQAKDLSAPLYMNVSHHSSKMLMIFFTAETVQNVRILAALPHLTVPRTRTIACGDLHW